MSSSAIHGANEVPIEILRINKQFAGAQTTVDRIDPRTGYATPIYVLHTDDKTIAVLYANPSSQVSPNQAFGTAKRHSFSSKIDVVFRGVPLKMKGNMASSGHKFEYRGMSYSWTKSVITRSTSTLHLKDSRGTLLVTWKKHPDGRFSSSETGPTFEVYVPPQSIDIDMVVVTGLASIHYWTRRTDTLDLLEAIFGA
ncbi:uncharacterized protein CTRU02_211539 [Colletotrichum truncatum]|uniref:Uncharacterized protein n=1 Tax=Colletotrichum truncatum TaxID=5467 RepID=A0ACC3YKZ6_COLTU|nr:uncharacterized protein CTRU02_13838 [Colletotrichum truncatum]KAF6782840.1 hypothetical protein CTRU02_13838 [Colletotrichum truncatum]